MKLVRGDPVGKCSKLVEWIYRWWGFELACIRAYFITFLWGRWHLYRSCSPTIKGLHIRIVSDHKCSWLDEKPPFHYTEECLSCWLHFWHFWFWESCLSFFSGKLIVAHAPLSYVDHYGKTSPLVKEHFDLCSKFLFTQNNPLLPTKSRPLLFCKYSFGLPWVIVGFKWPR